MLYASISATASNFSKSKSARPVKTGRILNLQSDNPDQGITNGPEKQYSKDRRIPCDRVATVPVSHGHCLKNLSSHPSHK